MCPSDGTIDTIARRALVAALALLAACHDYAPASTAPEDGDPPTALDVAYCTGIEPSWVAFQDGDGAWTRAEPAVAGRLTTFHHAFTANRGAVATLTLFDRGITSLSIQYGAPAELGFVGDTLARNCDFSAPHKLLGRVAGLDTSEVAFVSAGLLSRAAAHALSGGDFELRDLPAGPQDVLATRMAHAGDETTITGMILRRDLDLPDGATLPELDFGSAEAFQPAVSQATLAGLGTDAALLITGFRTAHSVHELELASGATTSAIRSYRAIPASRLEPGDLHVLTATTLASAGVTRATTLYFRAPADRTLAFGALPDAPSFGIASSTPTLRPRALFLPQADYDRFTGITYQQGQNTIVSVGMTPAYAARSGGAWVLTVPELTQVPGFDPAWTLHAGAPLLWTSARIGGTLPLGANAVPREGDTRRTGSSSGVLEP